MAINTLLDLLEVLCYLLILALLALIVKALFERGKQDELLKDDTALAQGTVPDSAEPQGGGDEVAREPDAPKRQESEQERLSRMEKELAERESRLKQEKIRELQDKENVIKRREEEEHSAPELERPQLRDDKMGAERTRIQDLIKRVEERYQAGELEEKNFKMILSDYHQQLIDLEVQMRRKR